ncbi:MAG: hypothetical protein JNM56_12230 [Planctomycetia bacterium]|nr:hypothetical protein [Planctomycetia bacterium]
MRLLLGCESGLHPAGRVLESDLPAPAGAGSTRKASSVPVADARAE